MFKTIALAALAALMGADAFVSPVATSFSGSAVSQRVSVLCVLGRRSFRHVESHQRCADEVRAAHAAEMPAPHTTSPIWSACHKEPWCVLFWLVVSELERPSCMKNIRWRWVPPVALAVRVWLDGPFFGPYPHACVSVLNGQDRQRRETSRRARWGTAVTCCVCAYASRHPCWRVFPSPEVDAAPPLDRALSRSCLCHPTMWQTFLGRTQRSTLGIVEVLAGADPEGVSHFW